MKILINYADEKYKSTQNFNSFTGKYIANFDKIIEYSPYCLDNEFRKKNNEILSKKRGNGLWLWKPYIIKKTLEESNVGDYIFYCDSGSFFIKNVNKILATMQDDVWISDLPLIEKQFTKGETFSKLGCDEKKYSESNQIQASFIAIKKTDKSLKFIEEWLMCCEDITLIDDEIYNKKILNDADYIDHRHDQSILSLLSKKHHLKTHLDPTQYGRIPKKFKREEFLYRPTDRPKEYPVCIILHRKKRVTFILIIKGLLNSYLPIRLVNKLIKNK